jgi:hypothetical protein
MDLYDLVEQRKLSKKKKLKEMEGPGFDPGQEMAQTPVSPEPKGMQDAAIVQAAQEVFQPTPEEIEAFKAKLRQVLDSMFTDKDYEGMAREQRGDDYVAPGFTGV